MHYVKLFIFVGFLVASCSQKSDNNSGSNQQKKETVVEQKVIDKQKAQPVNNTQQQALSSWQNPQVKKLTVKGYFPQFADNQTLLYSSKNYEGLWIYSISDETITQITDKRGAGYHPEIEGDTVIYQVKSRKKGLERALISKSKMIEQINSNLTPQRYIEKHHNSNKTYAAVADDMLSIEIVIENTRHKLTPNGKKNYLNASLSPNGELLLYEVSGGQAHIADLEGNIKTSLGEIDAPRWVGNRQVLYTARKDDGMQTISSKIYVKDLEEDTAFLLTDLKMIENPAINESGDMIVANTPDGDIYLITKSK